jgi:hypothetical protein
MVETTRQRTRPLVDLLTLAVENQHAVIHMVDPVEDAALRREMEYAAIYASTILARHRELPEHLRYVDVHEGDGIVTVDAGRVKGTNWSRSGSLQVEEKTVRRAVEDAPGITLAGVISEVFKANLAKIVSSMAREAAEDVRSSPRSTDPTERQPAGPLYITAPMTHHDGAETFYSEGEKLLVRGSFRSVQEFRDALSESTPDGLNAFLMRPGLPLDAVRQAFRRMVLFANPMRDETYRFVRKNYPAANIPDSILPESAKNQETTEEPEDPEADFVMERVRERRK